MEPVAFVIMPFGPSFDPVYAMFIEPSLRTAGFNPQRADDILSQRNILQDIVEGIENSSLVVADLTDSNPNVFYELGLAHARGKPVLLITQSVEDVPFDLRSYRLITYSTHFAEIESARDDLIKFAVGAKTGEVRFGSPVSDYLNIRVAHEIPAETHADEPVLQEEDPRGLVDHLELTETGFQRIVEIITRVSELSDALTVETNKASEELGRSTSGRQTVPYGHLRRIANNLASHLNEFTIEMRELNPAYESTARETEDSIEFLVTYPGVDEPENRQAVTEFLEVISTAYEGGTLAVQSHRRLAEIMDGLPPFEKGFIQATRTASREIKKMADNIDISLSAMRRGLEAGRQLLVSV